MRSAGGMAACTLAAMLVCGAEGAAAQDLVQNPAARQVTSLNGKWNVIVDPYENGFYNHRYQEYPDGYFRNRKPASPSDLVEYNFSDSPQLTVPGDWNSQDEELFFYEGTIWYQRDFELEKRTRKRYLLYFGAVNYSAVVYVNGVKVGEHEGGFTPFQFDVTDHVVDGSNFVVVKADNRRERANVPAMNTDWWNYGGITRPVTLLELNETYIKDYLVQLDPENAHAIAGWVHVAGMQKMQVPSVRVEIPELGIDQRFAVDNSGRATFRLPANPRLWSPADPNLYAVSLSYEDDVVVDRIGFRSIRTEGEDILLNGAPIYLRGISIHEESPTRPGRAWSEEDARTLLTWALELGCNFVRLAHYPHNETMVRMADEMGLLVWSEIPVYWTIDFESDQVFRKARQQLDEMISRDRNRASIILWSIANETPNNEGRLAFLDRLAARARELDDSRLTTAASDTQISVDDVRHIADPLAEIVDVIGVNSYCGWYSDTPERCAEMQWQSNYGKPVIVSEFGAGALQGYHGSPDLRWTEEYQLAVYDNNIAMLQNMSFVRGTTPWILKDFRSPRRPLPKVQDYWNRKGLLSETGIRKAAWYRLRQYYDELAENSAGD